MSHSSQGVSQWEPADLRPRGRSDGANRPIAHGRSPDRWLQSRFCGQSEAEMGAVVVIIRRVRGEKSLEVAPLQGDDVVEQIAPAAAYPAFRNTVLPGALD